MIFFHCPPCWTNCDKLIQNNETPKLFFFSIENFPFRPSYILSSLQTQPNDLICDILGKSLWVGTAGELTLYNISGNFIFSWLVVSCGCHGICGLRCSSLIFAAIYWGQFIFKFMFNALDSALFHPENMMQILCLFNERLHEGGPGITRLAC